MVHYCFERQRQGASLFKLSGQDGYCQDMSPTLKTATIGQLDAVTLYKLLQLRSEVFVVEQDCVYQDLDGRDCEPTTEHVWYEEGEGGKVLSTLRVLRDPDSAIRIGRVCTSATGRGQGLAAAMIEQVISEATGEVVLIAQSYLKKWYESLGFVVEGAEFVEDRIPHIPMRLQR